MAPCMVYIQSSKMTLSKLLNSEPQICHRGIKVLLQDKLVLMNTFSTEIVIFSYLLRCHWIPCSPA